MNRKQSGMSSMALLLILVAAAGVLLVAFKIGPLYVDNYFIKASVDSLQDEDVKAMSDVSIRRALERFFTVNGVRDISPKSAVVERETNRVIVKLDYEKRTNLIGNIDVVVRFENHYDTRDR